MRPLRSIQAIANPAFETQLLRIDFDVSRRCIAYAVALQVSGVRNAPSRKSMHAIVDGMAENTSRGGTR